jgi:hypothetical protein
MILLSLWGPVVAVSFLSFRNMTLLTKLMKYSRLIRD